MHVNQFVLYAQGRVNVTDRATAFTSFFLMVLIDFGNMTMATAIGFGLFVGYKKRW